MGLIDDNCYRPVRKGWHEITGLFLEKFKRGCWSNEAPDFVPYNTQKGFYVTEERVIRLKGTTFRYVKKAYTVD